MKSIALFLGGLIVGGIVVSFFFVSRVKVIPTVTQPIAIVSETAGAVRYNCKLSGGLVENGACVCPLESFQTQEEMYDAATGFCQSSFGGPGGAAFAASVGLPHGSYSYWNDIMVNLCENSGGSRSGAACICKDGNTFSKETGECEAN